MKKQIFTTLSIMGMLIAQISQAQPGQHIQPTFNHLTVYVTNLQVSTAFYKDVMWLDTIPEPFHDNRHTWFRVGEHGQLHVVGGAKQATAHDVNVHLAFSVPSVDAFIKHLEEMKITYGNFQGDPQKIAIRPDNIHQVYLQDPDGYWIEVNDDRF